MRDDLDELQGKAFDILIARVCPRIYGSGGQATSPAKKRLGLSPLDLFGADTMSVIRWRAGETIPRKSTLRRIMPNLVAFGIPEEMWWEAREISIQARGWRHKKHIFIRTKCRRGHERTPTNTQTDGQCRECRINRYKVKGQPISSSGYRGVRRTHNKSGSNLWEARLRNRNQARTIGYYPTPEEAARAYDAKVIELGLNHIQRGSDKRRLLNFL